MYSNKVGYLGGIAWALMTARICQLYPNALSSTIVVKFFKIYKEWCARVDRCARSANRAPSHHPTAPRFRAWLTQEMAQSRRSQGN